MALEPAPEPAPEMARAPGPNRAPGGAGAVLEAALSTQRAFMDTYGDALGQMLNLLVYMVPLEDEQGDAVGFYSQAVYSVTDLFGLYRTVLLRSPEALPIATPDAAAGSAGAMGHSRLQSARLSYTVAAFVLRALRSVQVLVEMRAVRIGGAIHALKVCMRVEVVKLVLKMVLRSKMPFAFYVDEDALEDVEPPKATDTVLGGPAPSPVPEVAHSAFVGARSGRVVPALCAPSAPASLRAFETSVACTRTVLAECLFHGRPLLHLMALMRRGRNSWAAWWTALLLDLAALGLLAPGVRPLPGSRASRLEGAEVRRRMNLLLWACIRSPAFDKFLRRPSLVLDSILSRIPIINVFRIVELFLALQPFYFTSSAS